MDKIRINPSIVLSELLHRTVSPEDTIMKAENYCKYKGLTELTYLDDTEVPVYAIVHNEIGNSYWGKGLNNLLAKASALMEFAERSNTINFDRGRIFNASYNDIADRAVSRFDLVPTNIQRELYSREIYNSLNINWYPCYSLFEDKEVFLPASLVGLNINTDFSDREDTNGLASGNCMEEALLHGLCELIERHAFDIYYFNKKPIELIDPFSCRIDVIRELVEALSAKGFKFYLADNTMDNPVSVVSLIMIRDGEQVFTPYTFTSAPGCHPHPEISFLRCITEIAQARVRYFYGKSVFKEYIERTVEPEALFNNELQKRKNAGKQKDIGDVLNISRRDIKEELNIILDYLRKRDMNVYIADLTSKEIPIPTIRVIVRNLQPVISADFRTTQQFVRVSSFLNDFDNIVNFSEQNRIDRIKNEDRIMEGDCRIFKYRLCFLYKIIRDFDRGIKLSHKLYCQYPEDKACITTYGEFLYLGGRYTDALEVFNGLMETLSERNDIISCAYFLMKIYFKLKRQREASEYIELILGLYPSDKLPSKPDIRELYVKTQLIKLKRDIEEAKCGYAKEKTPYTADKLFLLYYRKKDYQNALFYAKEVVKMNPNLVFGWQHLINAYDMLELDKDAKRTYDDAVGYFTGLGYSLEKVNGLFKKLK